jgi:hypothetical protein
MIINILSISAINNELEKIFSEARRTVSWDKKQIKLEIIEIREYLKYWKRNGILDIFFKEIILI